MTCCLARASQVPPSFTSKPTFALPRQRPSKPSKLRTGPVTFTVFVHGTSELPTTAIPVPPLVTRASDYDKAEPSAPPARRVRGKRERGSDDSTDGDDDDGGEAESDADATSGGGREWGTSGSVGDASAVSDGDSGSGDSEHWLVSHVRLKGFRCPRPLQLPK